MEKPDSAPSRRPRAGWQRVTPKRVQPRSTRETYRRNAPSPSEEILAKHDALLDEPVEDEHDTAETAEVVDLSDSQIICF